MVEVKEYLDNFFKGTKDITLNAMKYFIEEYNCFTENMKFIHIAGTNGKGSCVEIISNILIKQGYKVGKFLSPHLIKYNERISINENEISDEELSDLIQELEPKIVEYNKKYNSKVTFFELITIIGLIYFYRKEVDFVILETGLGGRYDSTNIITKPVVSIITSIDYDHMRILGNTLPEIAYQKAGIIKQDSNTIFFEQSKEVNKIFIEMCKSKNNKLHLITKDKIKNYNYDDKYQYFDYDSYKNLELVLKGKKQIGNAAICIECMKILNNLGYKVSENSIKEGLKTVIHKGRMEIVNQNPLIIFDGAHNVPAIENLQNTVKMYYSKFKRRYIVSILKRKDYQKMIQVLLEDKEAEFIFTSGNVSEKYVSKEELYNIGLKYNLKSKLKMEELNKAVESICKNKSDDIVNFIVGTFYTYGDIKDNINKMQSIDK